MHSSDIISSYFFLYIHIDLVVGWKTSLYVLRVPKRCADLFCSRSECWLNLSFSLPWAIVVTMKTIVYAKNKEFNNKCEHKIVKFIGRSVVK